MVSNVLLLLFPVTFLRGSSSTTVYECETKNEAICTLRNVQIASPEVANGIKLPQDQQVVHFIKGNIATFNEQLYRQLKSTTNLTITNCKVKELFVDPNLVLLDASKNQLTTLRRPTDANFANLKVLNLFDNQLTEVSYVLPFVELEELDLSSNVIETLDFGDFNALTKLKFLNLGNNPISVWPSTHGFQLESLQNLQLYNIRLQELSTHDWWLPSLTQLDLSSNLLYYLNGKDLLSSAPNLAQLTIYGNKWACHSLSKLIPVLQKNSVALTKSADECSSSSNVEGVCCENRFVDYVTMHSRWEVGRLQRELRSMNQSLVDKLGSVRTNQGVQIRTLKRQLAEQDVAMDELKRSLVQMDQLIDDLLEELYQRQLETDVMGRAKSRAARPVVVPVF